jgi:hypothetical protein
MTAIRLPAYLALLLLSTCLPAMASPTPNEYLPCHQQGAALLSACLDRDPGNANAGLHCWADAKRAHDACNANVRASHRPDPRQAGACLGVGGLMLWDKMQEVAPGQFKQVELLRVRMPGSVQALPPACVDAWEVDQAAIASIDQGGLLRIHQGAPDGTPVRVTAIVGEQRISGTLRVTDPSRHALTGSWTQASEQVCDGAAQRAPSEPIRELVFDAAGAFSVTLRPFEVYQDYRGEYRHDPAGGALALSKPKGNKVPPGLQLQGSAQVSGDELVLTNIVLWPAADGARLCSLRFTRSHSRR